MPPKLASFLTFCFIAFLFRRDSRQNANVTGALWLPFIWVFLNATRFLSQWFDLYGFSLGGSSTEEGSVLDASLFFGLIIAGLYVLQKRGISFGEIIRNNPWCAAFFAYCFFAILWSDFPYVSFKRWIKVLGHPILALVVLTEPDPKEALSRLMKRLAYVIAPMSVLFIKYYPEWGRGFSEWTGAGFNTGIATNKNSLGHDCMILIYFFAWHLLIMRRAEKSKASRNEVRLCLFFLGMLGWLLYQAHSSTSLVSLLIGLFIMLGLGLPFVNPRKVAFYIVTIIVIGTTAEMLFGVSGTILAILGKDATLTDRTLLWADLMKFNVDPIFGTGFECFWLGPRLQTIWANHWWQPNQAHNGYLECYLNMGLLGLLMLCCLIIATFRKCCRAVADNFDEGRFRLGLLLAIIFYNWTEASFKGLSPMFFLFLYVSLDYPTPQFNEQPILDTVSEKDKDLSYVSHLVACK